MFDFWEHNVELANSTEDKVSEKKVKLRSHESDLVFALVLQEVLAVCNLTGTTSQVR